MDVIVLTPEDHKFKLFTKACFLMIFLQYALPTDALGVLLAFYWCSFGVLLVFFWHFIGVLLAFYWCSFGVLLVFICTMCQFVIESAFKTIKEDSD